LNHPLLKKEKYFSRMRRLAFIVIIISAALQATAQEKKDSTVNPALQRPKKFSFITHIPYDSKMLMVELFKPKNLPLTAGIAAGTVLISFADYPIYTSVKQFLNRNNISSEESFKAIIRIKTGSKYTNIGKWPRNINTAIYNAGQGSSTMFLAAGFYLYGKIKHNVRALRIASQLTESFLALGLQTQVMKWAAGRQDPIVATDGKIIWRPFVSFKKFQTDKVQYDAFPSGHLATFTSMVTILGENFPHQRWIKPVGYGLSALLSLAMINNGVHWLGDYPLGAALGVIIGKIITRPHVIGKKVKHRHS
jgi:hypothetical protein